MIKLIAIDLIGVLAFEKDIELSNEESKLERLFGPNISDSEYLKQASNIINKDNIIIENITKNIINKLYDIKDKDIFTKLKKDYPDIKLIIATNHISYVKDFIYNNFNTTYLDDIIISSNIHKIKPNKDFYQYILDKYHLKPNELLFIDDNINNIESAKSLNINTIKIEKNNNLYLTIKDYLTTHK